jgi:hypothetical protein
MVLGPGIRVVCRGLGGDVIAWSRFCDASKDVADVSWPWFRLVPIRGWSLPDHGFRGVCRHQFESSVAIIIIMVFIIVIVVLVILQANNQTLI